MEKELISKLQKAGVSADVILALVLDEDDNKEAAAGTGAESASDRQTDAVQSAEETPKTAEERPPVNDAILAAINKLTGAIQASNIINAGAQGRPQAITVDDVMAKIIQPTAPENGG